MHSDLVAAVLGLGAVAYVILFAFATSQRNTNLFGALVITPILFLATMPIASRLARFDHDRSLKALIPAALAAKLFASIARYLVLEQVYDGLGDGNYYHHVGSTLAEQFHSGSYSLGPGSLIGTKFIGVLTGVVYTFTGPTKLGGFFVFAWLAFLGQLLFFRAFRTALPNADHHRYRLLVLFLPSLLFWPSSLGKDAWMLLTLGTAVYGAARLIQHLSGGAVLTGLGVAGSALVRPHVGALIVAGLFAATVIRRQSTNRSGVATAATFVAVLVGGILVAGRAATYLSPAAGGSRSVSDILEATELRSDTGRSAYQVTPRTLVAFPVTVVTVLFRPFPFEAHNLQTVIASAEGLVMLGLCIASWRRIAAAVRYCRRAPFLILSLVYAALFLYAFGALGNFGIIARQRTQVLPIILILLAVPPLGTEQTEEVGSAYEGKPRDGRVRVAVYVAAAALGIAFAAPLIVRTQPVETSSRGTDILAAINSTGPSGKPGFGGLFGGSYPASPASPAPPDSPSTTIAPPSTTSVATGPVAGPTTPAAGPAPATVAPSPSPTPATTTTERPVPTSGPPTSASTGSPSTVPPLTAPPATTSQPTISAPSGSPGVTRLEAPRS